MNVPIPKKINNLIESVNSSNCFSNSELFELLHGLQISRNDLNPFERLDHTLQESYGRFVLYNSPKLEVVAMSWNKDDYTSIHDHGAAQWGAVLCFGKIEHTSFELHENELYISEKQTCKNGDTLLVSNQLIHQMGNPFDQPAMTLHVYGTNTNVSQVTGSSRNYDPLKEKVFYANGGAFLKIAEQSIEKVEKCPKVQNEVYLHSANILLNYERKIRDNQIKFPRKKTNKIIERI